MLEAGDYEERVSPREGLTVEHEGAIAVGVDTALDDALVDEGIARDLVHHLQALRRDRGLAVTDRIRVTLRRQRARPSGCCGGTGAFISRARCWRSRSIRAPPTVA